MTIKVTIIIPAYNCSKFIEKSINSAIAGGINEIEILVVNDGSTDNTADIVSNISKKDSRVKLINKENGGSSSARNLGIKEAKGEYIFFLDSDDWISKNSLQKLYNKGVKDNLDVVVFNIMKEYDNKSEEWIDYDLKDNDISSGKDYVDKYLLNCCSPAAWNKLWKRKLFIDNCIFFPQEIDYGEDGATIPRLMINAQKVGKVNDFIYHYKIHDESKMFKKIINVYEYVKSYNLVMGYLKNKNYHCTDTVKFNYKYTYAYKTLEEVTFFDERMKSNYYKKLYSEFLGEVKKKENHLIEVDDNAFSKKDYMRSNIIIKSYKVNRIFGEISKIAFKYMKIFYRFLKS